MADPMIALRSTSDLSNLPGPGEWVFTLLLGGDVLASGKLTVTDNGASTG